MFYFFMDFMIIILETVCCLMFFDVFHKEKEDTTPSLSKMVSVAIISIISFFAASGLNNMPVVKQIVMFLLIVIVMTSLRKVPLKKSVVLTFLFRGLLLLVEFFAYMFVKMMVPDIEKMDVTQEVAGRIVVIIDLLFCFVAVLLISRIFEAHKNKIIFSEEWLKYILFPVITMILLAIILIKFKNVQDIEQIQALCGIGIGLVIMNFLTFYLLENVVRQEESLREMESLEIQGKNQLEMYKRITEDFEKQKTESHEFKNHIMCIQSLAEENKYEELKRYLKNIGNEFVEGTMMIDTNNDIVNAVINTKYKEAVKKHIVVVLRVNDLSKIKMEDRDIVILLSNLLNNAIEASEKLDGKRVIQVKFIQEFGNIILSVKNHYSEALIPVKGGYLTTKKHGENTHGVGVKNVIKVVDKYNGTYDISTENNEFYFSILIPDTI